MKPSELRLLIKEAVREVVKEELQDIKIMLLTERQVLKENFSFTTDNVAPVVKPKIDRTELARKMGIELPAPPQMKPIQVIPSTPTVQNIQPKTPLGAKFLEATKEQAETNPFLSILAQTADELSPNELNNFTNLGE